MRIKLLVGEGRPPRITDYHDYGGLDQIGVIFNVHGATIRRWVARARQRLLAATHERIAERLAVSQDECVSIVRLVRSQLDVSITRLLSKE